MDDESHILTSSSPEEAKRMLSCMAVPVSIKENKPLMYAKIKIKAKALNKSVYQINFEPQKLQKPNFQQQMKLLSTYFETRCVKRREKIEF